MIARLETRWHVGVQSFAQDGGYDPAEVPRELSWYVSASITDIAALVEADGYAYDFGHSSLRVVDGRVHMAMSWRLSAERAAWAAARRLDPRGPLRRDLAEHVAHELFTLPSVCETDAVMTAHYASGHGSIQRTWRPSDRRRATTH
ncbi:hypothetical protein [Streptomyces sp. NPDC004267]|uniref:hypothetical protein n=1 Tax=Streptomyces sp. NPDC004267 TaxID=3364694 RepID=UPI0036952039